MGTVKVLVNFAWSATDSASGISKYQLQQSTDQGAYTDITLPTDTTDWANVFLSPGTTNQFRVRAMDTAGNWSDWASGPAFVVDTFQETSNAITYGGSWQQQAVSSAYGGSLKYEQTTGASAKITFTGRNVAWIAPKDIDRGKAEVWLDGVKKTTVDLYSATSKPKLFAFTQNWNSSGTHTLEVRVQGTAGRPRVDVDAFIVLR
jgi:hypothetical protein